MSYCAPGVKGSQTCFTINGLRKIASSYNKTQATSEKDMISFDQRTSKMKLWNLIRAKLSNKCETEWCWLDLDFVQGLHDEELEGGFLPKGPAHNRQWLKTSDINKTMKQYEKLYPDFVFMGPVPSDFSQLNTELNNLDLEKLNNIGITKIGIIFNFDPHTRPGSHWVAIFIDLKGTGGRGGHGGPSIDYFDSFGTCPPPVEIQKLINSLNQTWKKLTGKSLFINCNTFRHQFSNSECGVYSIYFIVERLKGRSFDDVATQIILDDEINQYRSIFFRPL